MRSKKLWPPCHFLLHIIFLLLYWFVHALNSIFRFLGFLSLRQSLAKVYYPNLSFPLIEWFPLKKLKEPFNAYACLRTYSTVKYVGFSTPKLTLIGKSFDVYLFELALNIIIFVACYISLLIPISAKISEVVICSSSFTRFSYVDVGIPKKSNSWFKWSHCIEGIFYHWIIAICPIKNCWTNWKNRYVNLIDFISQKLFNISSPI